MSSVARHAAEVVKKNGYEEHVSIVRGRVEEVKIGVEKVDIIVSEWMGYCLLYESMLPSVLFARDKYLAGDGLLLPSSCLLYIGLAVCPISLGTTLSLASGTTWRDTRCTP